MTTTTEAKVTRCGNGTTLTTTGSNGKTLTIRVIESHGYKTPSCYAGKTFVLTHDSHTVSERVDGTRSEWDSYTGRFKNGTEIHFTHWVVNKAGSFEWHARKKTAFGGNNISVEIID